MTKYGDPFPTQYMLLGRELISTALTIRLHVQVNTGACRDNATDLRVNQMVLTCIHYAVASKNDARHTDYELSSPLE